MDFAANRQLMEETLELTVSLLVYLYFCLDTGSTANAEGRKTRAVAANGATAIARSMEKKQLNGTKLPEWSFASTVFKGTAEELLEAMESGKFAQEFANKEAVEKFLARPENVVEKQDNSTTKQ